MPKANLPEHATLSHCWGTSTFRTLQRDNLVCFKNKIPQEALSQTISDSIRIARDLGFRYIWIDTLCILQDDHTDWMREASLMSRVYGGSSLNIAASGAIDGKVGCFLQRSHAWKCLVEANLGDQRMRLQCAPQGMYYESLSKGPLARRGWALQERLLPPRTLHFTPTQLVWECNKLTTCESLPGELNGLMPKDQFWKKQPVTKSLWTFIVQSYSNCHLTYSNDKLVAISGLARIIQDQTRDEYIAGMWRKDLEFQLCWYSETGSSRLIPYRAPTWSWASCERCSIIYPDMRDFEVWRQHTTIWIQILGIELQYAGPDPLGQLAMANLQTSCSILLCIIVLRDYGIFHHAKIANEDTQFEAFYDCADDRPVPHRPYQAFAMPVYEQPSLFGKTLTRGLLLQPTGQEQGQYRRFGSFIVNNGFNGIKSFEECARDPSCQAKPSDCFQFSRHEDGTARYIINII